MLKKNILPVTGTREALFAFAQCFIDRNDNALLLMPNPFYRFMKAPRFFPVRHPTFTTP